MSEYPRIYTPNGQCLKNDRFDWIGECDSIFRMFTLSAMPYLVVLLPTGDVYTVYRQ